MTIGRGTLFQILKYIWDAFLWLVAFVFIELNVFEWREEAHQELAAAGRT